MDSNATWGAVEEGGAVVEGGLGVAEMGVGACTFVVAESTSGFVHLLDLSPPA